MRTPLAALILPGSLVLAACGQDAAPPQPAPPTDRNFTATVNDLPVVGGSAGFQCVIRPHGERDGEVFILTFSDDIGHTVQVAIDRGSEKAGPREIAFAMANAEGRAYGRPKDATAELTWIENGATGAVVSGKFSMQFELVNSAPGMDDGKPLVVRDALFEQVECIDPSKMRLPTPAE